MSRKGPIVHIAVLVCLSRVAFAQAPPSAGEILQQTQSTPALQEQTIETPRGVTVQVPDAPALSPADVSTVIDVNGYRVTGNTAFPERTLVRVIGNRTGRLTLTELEAAARAITRFYRDRGYLVARAYLPAQEITNGVPTIAVLEGRYDQIDVRNSSRLSTTRVERTLNNPLCDQPACSGSLVEAGSLERGLLLLADTPGVVPSSQLAPGTLVGTSRLELQALRAPLFRGMAEISNTGNRYTGATGVAGTIQVDSPLHFGDQVVLQVMGAEHQVFGGGQYSVPLNYAGTRLAVRFNYLTYALADRFAPLDARGTARTVDVSLSHSVVRTNRTNLMASLTFDHHRLKDEVGVTESSNPRSVIGGTAQVQANHTDTWLSAIGVSTASFAFTYGTLEFHDPVNAFFDELTARTAGDFHKFTLALSRQQLIMPRVAFFIGIDGQYTPRNLDSHEKFFLSGPTAVRAYPVGEVSGDRGVVASAELRLRVGTLFGGTIETAPLYDFGIAEINAQPFAAGPNERRLYGPGLRLGWAQARGVTLGATVAFRRAAQFQSIPDRPYTAWLSAGYRF